MPKKAPLLDVHAIVQSVIVALLLALLGAAASTYIEVRLLRHDMDRLEGIIDNLVDNASPGKH